MLDNERSQIVAYCTKMVSRGLTVATGGNISILERSSGLAALTPGGVDYELLKPDDIVITEMNGDIVEGDLKPTSEIDLHLCLYRKRIDINAVVHVHSPYATTLACLGWEIPPVSYLVCELGDKVPLIPYRTFGTRELAEAVSEGMNSYNAALMGNHGLVTVGRDLKEAFMRAEITEFLSSIYWRTRCAGNPIILGEKEMQDAYERFRSYGQDPETEGQ